MNIRKQKEKEFYVEHMPIFKVLNLNDPFFIIKTAFFQKGKFGRHFQLFESELEKEQDIYIEFYDNVNDNNGVLIDVTPFTEDRQLYKFKHNPFYLEEYERKEGTNYKGEPYSLYTIPVSEMIAILKDGTELPYNVYEKRKTTAEVKAKEEEINLPKLQNSLFPDFEEKFPSKEEDIIVLNNDESESTSDILKTIAREFQKLAQKL
jgi:hypothetical protein